MLLFWIGRCIYGLKGLDHVWLAFTVSKVFAVATLLYRRMTEHLEFSISRRIFAQPVRFIYNIYIYIIYFKDRASEFFARHYAFCINLQRSNLSFPKSLEKCCTSNSGKWCSYLYSLMWFLISNSSFLVLKVCDPDWDRAKQRKAKIQEALASKDPATSWRFGRVLL